MELGKIAAEKALKVLSYRKLDVKTGYKLQRTLERVGQLSILRPLFHADDLTILCDDEHSVLTRIFWPKERTREEAVIFFHGGGWVTGDVDTYNRVCAVTARSIGCPVASVDYRLAPENKFPAGVEDCYAATRYLFWHAMDVFGINPDKITLMGDSAGGNLAAVVSLLARDRGEFSPRQQILLYPATYNDHSDASPYASVRENGTDYVLTAKDIRDYMELYQSCPEDRLSPYFAPLLAKDLSHQPRTMVITAQFDPLRDEGEDYGRKLEKAGNDVEIYRMQQVIHGFFSLPAGTAPVRRCCRLIQGFLDGKEAEVANEIEGEHALEPIG